MTYQHHKANFVRLICTGLLVGIATIGTAVAQTASSECDPPSTTVVYGNGINNTLTDAYVSLRRTEWLVRGVLPSDAQQLRFALALNPSDGVIIDLIEALDQLLDQAVPATLLLEYILGRTSPPVQVGVALARVIGENLRTPVLSKHVALYRNRISEGDRVFLFAHSQGNFFANEAYSKLTAEEQKYFGLISVATPAAVVAGGGPYVTLVGDFIWWVPGALPPAPAGPGRSTTNSDPPGDGHNYLSYYAFRGTISRALLEDAVRGFNETIASPSGKGTDCDPQDPQDPEEPQEPGVGEGALLFYSVYAAAGEAYGGATSFPRGESNGTQGDAGAGSPQQLAWSFAATFDGERSYNVCDSGDPVTCTTVTYPLSAHKSVSAQMRQVGPLEWEFMYRVDGQINYGYELTAEARALYGDFPIGAVPVFAQGSFLAGVMVNLDRDYVLELTVTSGGSYSRSTATATSDPYNPPSVVLRTLGSGTLGDVPLDLRQTDILNIPRIVNRSNAIGHAANFCLQAESVTGVCPDSVMDPTLVLLLPDGMPIQRLVRPGKRTFGIMLDSFVNFSTNTRLNTVPVRASIDQGQAHVRLRFWPAD